jgi:hypothetical protein
VAAEPPKKKKRTGLIVVAILALLALLAIGAVGAVALLGGSSSDLQPTVDKCVIDADGALTAAGTVKNDGSDSARATVKVTFDQVPGGKQVDTATADVTVRGNGRAAWSAGGTAGDSVKKVSCVVTEVTKR